MPYRVFLNAPTYASLGKIGHESSFSWQTVESGDQDRNGQSTPHGQADLVSSLRTSISKETSNQDDGGVLDWLLPPATLGAASQRISEMYRHVIFPEDEEEGEEGLETVEETIGEENESEDRSYFASREESLIQWPPSNASQTRSRAFLSRTISRSQFESGEYSEEVSYAHSSTSSITAFPTFVINLRTLASLSELESVTSNAGKWTRKVNLLVAVLEVDGPVDVRIKRGPDAGREIGVLKLVVGGEEGGICKLTAWREVADLWGGVLEVDVDESTLESGGVKRGDIVYLENILASSPQAPESDQPHAGKGTVLTASPSLGSRLHTCYRTLPTVPSDRRFRPDLRLAASDPGLRKVASVVRWLEGIMGLGHA